MIRRLRIETPSQGLHEITDLVRGVLEQANVEEGLCTIFVRHTSASVIIQENADPSARQDLESWMNRLVPERDTLFTHTSEGPDDMPSHIKSALTATSVAIPVVRGSLDLGTWQGIYLWEHRTGGKTRTCTIHIGS